MSDLAGLLERVKAATGPDSNIDLMISELLWSPANGEQPRFTASIDVAIDLVEKTLPSWDWKLRSMVKIGSYDPKISICCLVRQNYSGVSDNFEGRGHSVPLAILTALLTALIA